MEELALLTGQREHRDERENDDRHREEDGSPDEPRGVDDGLGDATAIPRVHSTLLDKAEGVLGDDDRRVHEHADGDRDAGQGHDVGGEPEIAHEEERRQDGQRQRDRHDEDRTDVEQEEHVHERDDDRLFDQGALERLDGALDERRAVVERHDPHARRQPRLERSDLLPHTVDDADRADAVARDDHAADGFLGALDERGHAEGVAELHVGDLAHEDRHAVLGADDHLLEIADALDQAETADDRPRPARLDDVAADVAVASHDGVDHGGERDPVRAQAVGIDVDLVLAHGSADAGHLGHAGHRVELVADEPVL